MKYLPLILFLIGCSPVPKSGIREPKFMMDQKVTYVVPKFYSLVCSGKAKVVDYRTGFVPGTFFYVLETPPGTTDYDCPYHISGVEEKEIEAAK